MRDANLKGNVLAVQYGKYEYKENFGEPTAGGMYEMNATFYDELGRSILYRSVVVSSGDVFPKSFLFEYEDDGGNLKVIRRSVSTTNKSNEVGKYQQVILSADGHFEKLMQTLQGSYGRDAFYPQNSAEFVFDKNQVMTSHTIKANKHIGFTSRFLCLEFGQKP